ncbi:unnamed protein product [Microthlaspi erraticum]|uniref:FKB95-like N-terminal Kelch domain-containing protein n=1 Tax=Microthlaspi erraticum TaxID=1685480 RepID=A0A6D2HRQ0_9BRAS|nr:unnamed protein product [Microthlaspi erraticum]CAA7042340.1 unnamed protein product [Microthlaspi erraticum]CAA7043900.1 unnamed protein product [Microthlaspi erraticum]
MKEPRVSLIFFISLSLFTTFVILIITILFGIVIVLLIIPVLFRIIIFGIGYALAKIQASHSGTHQSSRSLVTIASDIYNIGGPIDDDDRSSNVSILDCRSNTWREGPKMLVKRSCTAANVVDGKIYVTGGCLDGFQDCSRPCDWMEVFDPKTQTWELVPSQGAKICGCAISKSAGADGKVYVFGSCKGLAYEPSEGRWERLGWDMDYGWDWFSYRVIGGVLYMFNEGVFKWYEGKAGVWRVVKGVKGLPKIPRYIAKLADYGGKMVVLWEKVVAYKEKMVLCAVIALERRDDEEIWGKVEWFDTVFTVPNKSCSIECALGVTV